MMPKKKTKKKKRKKSTKRVDLDVRPIGPWFRNFDYGGPEEGSEISPGRGLYHGKMDKYKSVKEFIEKSRKRKHRKRALLELYNLVIKANEEDC